MIRAVDSASRRTKNRASQHTLRKTTKIFHTKPQNVVYGHSLYDCMDDDCPWLGWLPDTELEEVEDER